MTLLQKLLDAGLPIASASESGEVSFLPGTTPTPEQEIQFREIVMAYFNPIDFAIYKRMQKRQTKSKSEAALATQIRQLTPQEAVDYIESNVTTLATAKSAMKIMVRMLIALRDQTWPDLPE
jgi:hypothetical protein